MKRVKATKHERRMRRKDKQGGRGRLRLAPLGGSMAPDLVDRILAAAGATPPDGPWIEVAPLVLPILRRQTHPFPAEMAPLLVQVPPGIWTGFGMDFGPAFAHVTHEQVERWGIERATLLATALDNLRALIVREPPQVERLSPEGFDTVAVQGEGWGSSLVLTPDVLGPILGSEPRLLLAPVRNMLLALPPDADLDFVERLWAAVADGAHDELDVPPLRWTGTTVVALGDRSSGLPN
jgi:hypothetical protein